MRLERKAMGLQLEECQVAKFNLMNSAVRPKSRREICFWVFFFVKKKLFFMSRSACEWSDIFPESKNFYL